MTRPASSDCRVAGTSVRELTVRISIVAVKRVESNGKHAVGSIATGDWTEKIKRNDGDLRNIFMR